MGELAARDSNASCPHGGYPQVEERRSFILVGQDKWLVKILLAMESLWPAAASPGSRAHVSYAVCGAMESCESLSDGATTVGGFCWTNGDAIRNWYRSTFLGAA